MMGKERNVIVIMNKKMKKSIMRKGKCHLKTMKERERKKERQEQIK